MKTSEFMQKLLTAAREAGIAEAEAYYDANESASITVVLGEVDEYAVSTTGGLSLRGLVDGRMGAAYTEALDEDAIAMLVRGVKESAELINDEDQQFIFEGSPAYTQVNTEGDLDTLQKRMDLAMAVHNAAHGGSDGRIQPEGYSIVQTDRAEVRIVNTRGLDLRRTADTCVAMSEVLARDGERSASGVSVWASRNLPALQAEQIAKEASDEALFFLNASPCESGEMPVIFRNTAMQDMIGAFLSAFSAEAAQKGTSLLAGKEGETIAAPCVSFVDDPLLPEGLYTRAFDAEGVATHKKSVIEKGVLKTLLHNLKTANKAGCASTGNAMRAGYMGAIGIAPTNMCVLPGDKDLPALEAQMQNGLVITDVSGLHAGTNAISGDFSLLSKGYLVRDGKRGQAVEQVTVAGNFFTLLKDIEAVARDVRSATGRVISPSVLVKSLSVAGK